MTGCQYAVAVAAAQPAEKLAMFLNAQASQGWRVKNSHLVPGRWSLISQGDADMELGLLIIFERLPEFARVVGEPLRHGRPATGRIEPEPVGDAELAALLASLGGSVTTEEAPDADVEKGARVGHEGL